MARRRPRWNVRERMGGVDRTNLAVALAGLLLVLVLVLPRVYPAARMGIECSSLSAPIGGNNRSVLAQAGNDQQNLTLELHLDSDVMRQGEALKITLTFANNDIGPVILYLDNRQPTLNNSLNAPGIDFLVSSVAAGTPTVTNPLPVIQGSYIPPDFLHLLGSRSRCTERFEFPPAVHGLVPGEYRIQAFYRNNNTGAQRVLTAGEATPTATPAYPFSQGVWVGAIRSQEIRFTVTS